MFLQFKTPWGTHGTGGMVYRHAHAAYMALNVLNWFCTRNCGGGRPHVGLCPAHFVLACSQWRRTVPVQCAVVGCTLKQHANEGCNSCTRVVQVLQDLMFCVLLHVLFYL